MNPEPNLASENKRPLCALIIGHKKYSPGAKNAAHSLSEFEFNDELSRIIESKVRNSMVQRVYRRTYKDLPYDINELNPDFIISLHCNAFDGKVSGTETLYYHKSIKGRQFAEIVQRLILTCLALKDRGIKACTVEEKGGYLLKYTKAPCVIAEPFFIDNDKDLNAALVKKEKLAGAYAEAIDEIARTFGKPQKYPDMV